jgi:hypothetical protein
VIGAAAAGAFVRGSVVRWKGLAVVVCARILDLARI